MSKTERDLSSDGDVDALDDLFTDESFDDAFDDAIEHADLELDIADLETLDDDDADADDDDAEGSVAESDDADDADSEADVASDEESDATAEVDLDDADADDEVDAASDGDVDDAADVDVDDDAEDLSVEAEELESDADDPTADAESDDVSDDEDYVLPEIVPATSDTDTDVDGRESPDELDESDDVSEDILEELRRADIDGPVVAHAPQDDTTAAVRRPRRSADYDPAPVPIPAKVPRVLGRKPRVRKVTRVVRHVDPWSVFKIAIVANMVLYIIVLTASVLLWNVANATGTVDNVERFFESFGWNSFEFNGGELYHAGWIAGLFIVIGMTGLAVLGATLFNLITDLVGGVRFTVLEEEVVETRTSPMRRFVVRRPEPEVPALLHDSSGPMYREAVVDDTGANQRPTR